MSDTISAEDLANAKGVRIIDIRKAPDDRMIPGSEIMIGAEIEANPPFDRSEEVILYCGSGNSCGRIAAELSERGYNTRALEGGYKAWQEAGLPTKERAEG